MRNFITLTVLFCLSAFAAYSQWTTATVPDPKKTGDGFVSNPDNILSPYEVTYINGAIQGLKDSTKVEIAVVMLQSIGSEVPKTFATELFNLWGVGSALNDNGLLILFVMDQRRIEFETGYGMEQVLSDAACYDIQQQFMVPRFKEGLYGQGMIDGIDASIRIIRGESDVIIPSGNLPESSYENNYEYPNGYPEFSYYQRNKGILDFYFGLAAVTLLLFITLLIIAFFNKDYFVRYQLMRLFRLYIWFIIIPIPFIGIYIWVKNLTDKWRNTPRISAKTGLTMHKLSEEEDNNYLEKGQIAEENVKSVDYDVWVSGEEGDVLIQKYKRWFSKYNSCPKCKYKTYYKVYDRVITAPTYTSSGTGERQYSCTNCGHTKTTRYTIPRKTKSSTSSSGSSSWGGGSSSWGGGGGSWGGGSSGGGGAGSSW